MSTNPPVCPILSTRNSEYNELCLGDICALFLPGAGKCSLVYIGYQALIEVQKAQAEQKAVKS